MVAVATLVSSGGCVGRRPPPPHAVRNRNEPRHRKRNHHSRKKRKKAKKGNTRETSHIVILFFVLFRFFRLNRLLLPPGSCPENKMFRLCSTEKAVCSVPVRAYLRVTGHESRTTAWEPRMNADKRRSERGKTIWRWWQRSFRPAAAWDGVSPRPTPHATATEVTIAERNEKRRKRETQGRRPTSWSFFWLIRFSRTSLIRARPKAGVRRRFSALHQ